MDSTDTFAFARLFKDACEKCFGHVLEKPLNETESKLLYNKIFEQTGLVIGWKSIKNYSSYVLNGSQGKQENPSAATLDTLARYVLNAPHTDELERKNKESHYPYWFEYKKDVSQQKGLERHERPGSPRSEANEAAITTRASKKFISTAVVAAVIIVAVLISWLLIKNERPAMFTENFSSINEDSLRDHGWFLQAKDTVYWNKRNTTPGTLALFTLTGDNWPDSIHTPRIKNLMLRKISSDCFISEVHLKDFFPKQNWQQAGIILMEDTSFAGKSARLSIAYNDYMGAEPRTGEINIQAISSQGNGLSQPEEIAHKTIFNLAADSTRIGYDLQHSALRIEKQGKLFRFLYSNSALENAAFHEVASQQLDMSPKYIGIFALQGFVNDTNYIPAHFTFFSVAEERCE